MKFFLKISKVLCKRYISAWGFRRKLFYDKYCSKSTISWDFKRKVIPKERFSELLFLMYMY